MRLGIPKFIRPVIYAALVLVLGVCGLEVWLRVEDSLQSRAARPEVSGDGLVVPSWTVHHELKPLRRVDFVPPDGGDRVEVRTNSFGLRGGEPVVPKPPELFRILCLGDDTILGPDVPEEQTVSSRLGGLLGTRSEQPIEVLNAGTPGDCPLMSYLRLRHSLAALRPDLVIVGFDMGDVADDYRLRRHVEVADGNVPVACPSAELRRSEAMADPGAEPYLLPGWLKSKVMEWTGSGPVEASVREIDSPRGRYAWLREQHGEWDVYVEQAFSALVLLQQACDEAGCELVVAVHPAPWQVSSSAGSVELRNSLGIGATDHYPGREPFDRLGRFLAEKGIMYCDGSEAFRRSAKPETLFLRNAPRFSPAGHELHARVLATYLLQRVTGPWRDRNDSVPVPRLVREGRGPS